ncbi:unnamed protein product [Closterium sp. NIES-54]
MASLCVLAFDQEGGPLQLNTWLDDLQLYLLSDSRDSVSLFDDTSGAAPTPPATADNATRSQWLTRDAASRLAIRNHLPLAECAHFGQHRTPQTLYDAVVARYSSPATTALGRLLLPYLFPELSAFATIKDLVSHLRASNARYRAALPAEFLDKNPPLMYIALYFIVTRLPESLRSNRDHSLDPTSLIVDLLEQHLLATETRAVAVGAARGTPCTPCPLLRLCCCSRRPYGGSGGGGSGGSGGGSGGVGSGDGGSGGSGGSGSGGSGGGRTGAPRGGFGGGQWQWQLRQSEIPSPQQLREWFAQRGASRGSVSCPSGDAIFDLDYDAILFAMYALSASAEGDCYRCVSPNPGIDAAALCASESLLPGTAPAEALHTFTPDSGASRCFFRDSTTLTPLPALVPVRLADPSRGPVVARSFTVLLCPAVLSGSLSDLHLPSFSTNLVGTAALQDAMVTTTTPQGQRVWICTCTRTVRHLAMFTRRPRSSLYTLATQPPQVAASAQVSVSRQVAPPCSCRLLSHQTLLWHHRLGHPSLPRLRGMHSRLLVSGLPQSLPPLPPSPAPPCLPCIEGWQRAAPHSSSFPRTTAPLHTLHMDVWSPAHISGQDRKRYFLLLRERFRADLRVLRLHSDRGGEFSCNLLRDFCRGEGILQSFTLPHSPQQNGIAKRRIGLVMEVARSSMIHAASPHLLWLFAVWSGVLVPLFAIRPRTSSPPALFPASSLALPLTCLADSFTTPPRAVSSPLKTSHLTNPLPPQGLAPSGVSLPGTLPAEVAVGLGAARGAASGGAVSGSAEAMVAKSEGSGSGGPAGASLRLSLQKLREWLVRCPRLRSGATGAGDVGAAGAGGAGVTAEAGGTGGTAATCPGGARTRGTGAARTGGVRGAGAGDPTEHGAIGAGGSSAGGAGAEGARAGGTGAGGAGAGGGGVGGTDAGGAGAGGTDVGGAGVGGTGAGGAGAGGAGAVDSRDTVRARPYFVPLLQQVLDVPSSPVLGLVLTLPHLLTA